MERPELYVLRHGETAWNVEGRMQGRLDSALTARGRAQALAQGATLAAAGVSAASHGFFTSPQGRSVASAALVAQALGAAAVADARLAEIDMGLWTGRTLVEIEAEHPGLFARHPGIGWYAHLPQGERLPELRRRVAGFLAGLAGPAVVVTHGVTSAALRAEWLGLDEAAMLALPGGQGVVWHLADGAMRRLGPG